MEVLLTTTDGLRFYHREGTSDVKAIAEACGHVGNGAKPAYYRMYKDPVFRAVAGDAWLDLGAHIGAFACRAAHDGAARVIAVEPCAANHALLVRNVAANGFAKKVNVLRACVGTALDPPSVSLNLTTSTYRHTVLKPTTPSTGQTEAVPCVSLAELLRDNPEVNAIKMDIEGSERRVLLDTDLFCTNVEKLVFEYSFDHLPSKDDFQYLCSHLRRQDFAVYYSKSLDGMPETWDKRSTRGNNGALVWCTRSVMRCERIRSITAREAGCFYGLHSAAVGDTKVNDHVFSAEERDDPGGEWFVLDRNVKMVDDATGEPLLMLLCGAMAEDMVTAAAEALAGAAKGCGNHNRGVAGGRIDLERIRAHGRPGLQVGRATEFSLYPLTQDGRVSNSHVGNPTDSAIVGWTDAAPRDTAGGGARKRRRLSAWTATHMAEYEAAWPCLQKASDLLRACYPHHWQRQMARAAAADARIGNTAFSTATVNWRFRSALHADKGDFKDGMGCIFMQTTGEGGGELLFPEYGLAVRMQTGDVLFFNPHLWHCTAPFSDDNERISVVCYFREKLSQ